MKNKILSFILCFSIFSIISTPKSNAIVGLILKRETVKTFGIMATGAGSATFMSGIALGLSTSATASANYVAITAIVLGPLTSTLGLVILDEGKINNIEFNPISKDSSDYYNFSQSEIEIYNSEIDEVNAIKRTIEKEIKENDLTLEQSQILWSEYSTFLSQITVEIVQKKSSDFIKGIR